MYVHTGDYVRPHTHDKVEEVDVCDNSIPRHLVDRISILNEPIVKRNLSSIINVIHNMKFKNDDIKKCLMHFAPEGWEFYTMKNDRFSQWVKIRRPYQKGEIKLNEDGYKYDTIFLNLGKTQHYLYMTKLGYKIDIEL